VDEESRRGLGLLAYRAARRLSWERTTGQYRSLVQALLDRPATAVRATATAMAAAEEKEAGSWQPIR
jgi:hypothetical protein